MKLRIDSVEPRNDGSGKVAFDVWALETVTIDGQTSDVVIPSRHMTVLLNSSEVKAAMALPVAQRVPQIKTLLLNAVHEFQKSELDAVVAANKASTEASTLLTSAYTLPVSITL